MMAVKNGRRSFVAVVQFAWEPYNRCPTIGVVVVGMIKDAVAYGPVGFAQEALLIVIVILTAAVLISVVTIAAVLMVKPMMVRTVLLVVLKPVRMLVTLQKETLTALT